MEDAENAGPKMRTMRTGIWGIGKCETWKIKDRIMAFQQTMDYRESAASAWTLHIGWASWDIALVPYGDARFRDACVDILAWVAT